MESKPKRPIAIWITVVLLLLNAIYVVGQLGYVINLLSYYSIPYSIMIERLAVRFAIVLIAVLASLVAVGLILKRSNRGRWLAVFSLLVLLVNYLFNTFTSPQSEWRSIGTAAEFVIHSINLALWIFPTVLTIALLTMGKRTNAYFRKTFEDEDEYLKAEPPPPPVFES